MALSGAILLVFVLACSAMAAEGDLEDLLSTTDSEFSTDETDSLLKLLSESDGSGGGSRDPIQRVRFSIAVAGQSSPEKVLNPRSLWARTRLSARSGRATRFELLGVRRSDDPRAMDELHVTAKGSYKPARLDYAAGTFQLDWGLGAVSGSSFPAIRQMAHVRTVYPSSPRGIVASPTAREASWWRGIVLSRKVSLVDVVAFGSIREWNARDNVEDAVLSGLLSTESASAIDQRDALEERALGAAITLETGTITTGFLGTRSEFSQPVESVGSVLNAASLYAKWQNKGTAICSEFARSGDRSACCAVASQGTDRWRGAFYAICAGDNYFAPRSQGAFSFGEPLGAVRTIGIRAGVTRNAHDFHADLRSSSQPVTALPERETGELIFGWDANWTDQLTTAGRVSVARRDDADDPVYEVRSVNYRFEARWQREIEWAIRVDSRAIASDDETVLGRGNYLHLQANRRDGKLRPGLRIAAFHLDELNSPFSVYEPTINGAYPLETLSGNGTRIAGWITAVMGAWRLQAKAAVYARETGHDTREFALSLSYWQ